MTIYKGNTHIWKKEPHVGPVMVKSITPNSVELYDMLMDEDFIVSQKEYADCKNVVALDEAMQFVDPDQYKHSVEMFQRAFAHCGVILDRGQNYEALIMSGHKETNFNEKTMRTAPYYRQFDKRKF
jgi:hypothetical protein